MPWTDQALGRRVVHGDWAQPGLLQHIDPYLVWFDVTGFRGAALPQACRLPMIEELRDGGFRTGLRAIEKLGPWLHTGQAHGGFGPGGEVRRFEISPGIAASGDLADPPETRLKNHQQSIRKRRGNRPVVGFIDHGCAFAHPHFRQGGPGSGTRVLALWDQSLQVSQPTPAGALQWRTPPDFCYGGETHRDSQWPGPPGALTLAQYIARHTRDGRVDEDACYRHSGHAAVANRRATHGTHVMDVATGHPDPLAALGSGRPARGGWRHDADIVFVQLPRQLQGRQIGGLLRSNVFDGLQYIASCAPEDADVVVNLSYGGYAGPHDGSSVLERAIDDFLSKQRQRRRFELVIPAGNARLRRLHASDELPPGKTATFQWNNLPDDPTDSFVEIWVPRRTGVQIRITGPGGAGSSGWRRPGTASCLWRAGQPPGGPPVAALVYPQQACQSDADTMALLAVAPTRVGHGPAALYGAWRIEVHNGTARPVEVHAWCEMDEPALGSEDPPRQPYFSDGFGVDARRTRSGTGPGVDPEHTLNGIGHGEAPVVVGGRALGGPVAPYSGTGPGRGVAPGRRDRTRRPANDPPRRGPEDLAPSDEHAALPGVSAAGVLGTERVRLNGTSVAAAVVTRMLFEGRYQRREPPRQGQRPPPDQGQKRGLPRHPDSDLLAPGGPAAPAAPSADP